MMRMGIACCALLAAWPLLAQTAAGKTLAVNAAPTEEVWGEATVALARTVAAAQGETAVLDAVMTFSRPTEPLETPSAEDLLALAANPEGQVVVYDGTAWKPTGATVPETGEATLAVRIVASVSDAPCFKVKVGTAEEVIVPAKKVAVSTLLFDGEGSATQVAVATVTTAILPPAAEGGAQDEALVEKYAAWAQDAEKGGAMAGASDAEKSDAFAMNVGGKPTLAVTAIEPQADGAVRIAVKGAYEKGGAVADAPLGAIHGTLYATYAETLGGAAKTEAFAVTVAADGTATFTVPAEKKARFLRARVALAKPEDSL